MLGIHKALSGAVGAGEHSAKASSILGVKGRGESEFLASARVVVMASLFAPIPRIWCSCSGNSHMIVLLEPRTMRCRGRFPLVSYEGRDSSPLLSWSLLLYNARRDRGGGEGGQAGYESFGSRGR